MATDTGDGFDLQAHMAAAMGSQSVGDQLIPLWRARPEVVTPARRRQGGAYDPSEKTITGLAPSAQFYTSDQAEASFLDMPDTDKTDFIDAAQRVGLLGKTPTPAEVASAWAKAVAVAKQYNAVQSDKSQWVSPWEAVQKLGLKDAAANGASYDGYSHQTNTRIYSTSDLATSAETVLRNELGRGPTPSELQAYTIAVNNASAANPQVSTTYTDGQGNTSTTNSGGIDPNQVMLDKVRQDPERARVQAATTYFSDAMRALGSVV